MRDAICHFIDWATPFKACCEAGDGVAAIEKAKEPAPALVILDLSMPRMNVQNRGCRSQEPNWLLFEGRDLIAVAAHKPAND